MVTHIKYELHVRKKEQFVKRMYQQLQFKYFYKRISGAKRIQITNNLIFISYLKSTKVLIN